MDENPIALRDVDLAEHHEAVLRFVTGVVGNRDLAEELTQEVFLRAERKKASFQGRSSARTWLHAIALNACRDHFRAKSHAIQPVSDLTAVEDLPSGENVEREFLEAEMAACISSYLFKLPERQRDVVALHDIAGLNHREISRLCGLSEANARVTLHRGRAALRKLLAEGCTLSFDDPIPCEPRS
jgi:RNA polymerase sigma-70 factor (ECF subfamily)